MKSIKPYFAIAAVLTLTTSFSTVALAGNGNLAIDNVFAPLDNNAANNPAIQPDPEFDPDPDGDIPDQTMQFGEVMRGGGFLFRKNNDFLYGGLGTDVIFGKLGNDVIMGGPEHFNPLNRDRAFGGSGTDVFVWQPGDGSDRFEGSRGHDGVIFGFIAQDDDGDRVLFDADDDGNGNPNFRVRRDELAGVVLMRPDELLPLVDVANVVGTCEVLDRNTEIPNVEDTAQAFDDLDIDHLIRFRLRNGNLAVTVQTKNVENVVCGGPEIGKTIEVFDLKVSPPQSIVLHATTRIDVSNKFMNSTLRKRMEQLLVDSAAEIADGNAEIGVAVEDF